MRPVQTVRSPWEVKFLAEQEAHEATRRQLDEARGDAARLREALEQAQVQLAGCGVAALGGIGPGIAIQRSDYGWSRSYADVVALREKYEALLVPAPNPPQPPLPQEVETDRGPRAPGCKCHREEGDSECPVHDSAPQGVETGMKPGQRCTRQPHAGAAHWWIRDSDGNDFNRCEYIEPSAPQAPATFEQLVTAAGTLPTTGMAGAEAPATGLDAGTMEAAAKMFHETYERLAPEYGWTTNAATACAWEKVPPQNRNLMTAVVGTVLRAISSREGVK